jgi:hypothetical protein
VGIPPVVISGRLAAERVVGAQRSQAVKSSRRVLVR